MYIIYAQSTGLESEFAKTTAKGNAFIIAQAITGIYDAVYISNTNPKAGDKRVMTIKA